jgi:tight adherence protein B
MFEAIGFCAALALFCGTQALFWRWRRQRRRREARLIQRMRASAFVDAEIDDGWRRPGRGGGGSWLDRLRGVQRLEVVLAQAGMTVSARRFLSILGAVLALVLVAVTVVTANIISGAVFDLVFVVFVYIYVSARRRKRIGRIDEQLPQALELMIFGLRAGHPLEQAIQFVSTEMPDPLGTELRRCYEEYEMGRALEAALVDLSQRLDTSRALRTFVEAVVVLKQTGGNLVEVMEQIISTLRAQAAYEARYRALTAEGRTSGLILGALPLLILAAVLLVQPGYLGSLFSSSSGRIVLAVAFLLWGLGVIWLMRLVRPAL